MLYLAQVFIVLIDLTTATVIFFLSFAQPFLHFFFLRIHADEFFLIGLRTGCNGLGFFFVLLKFFSIDTDAICTLFQALLLETNLLFHALHSILLLVEENILFIEVGRFLAEQFIL